MKEETDITDVLRDMAQGRRNKLGDFWHPSFCAEAADTIDALRAKVARLKMHPKNHAETCDCYACVPF